jgi:hypothetical protein
MAPVIAGSCLRQQLANAHPATGASMRATKNRLTPMSAGQRLRSALLVGLSGPSPAIVKSWFEYTVA